MGKTLYLNENKDLSVRRDGPSLWIVQKGKAGVRVPARRVDRVVIAGNVQFNTDMLMLFAERGVPITFLNRRGEPTATALGIRTPDWSLRERQYLLGMTKEGRTRAENWMRAKIRGRQMEFLRKFLPASAKRCQRRGLREEEFGKTVKLLLSREDKALHAVRTVIEGLFFEVLLKTVNDTGLDPHCGIVSRREDLGLVKDLARILEPEILRQVTQFFAKMDRGSAAENNAKKKLFLYKKGGTWKLDRQGRRDVITRFENQRERLVILIEGLVEDLIRAIRESVYEDKISCML